MSGCSDARSMVRPLPVAPSTVDVGAGVRVTVDALTASTELGLLELTAPALTADDVALLARFYTVLWVEVRNDALLPVIVDPARAIVFDQTGTPWVALDKAQRVNVLQWQPWSWGAWTASRVSAGRLERLTAKLDRLQLAAGPLAVSETRRGVVVFKRIPMPACQRVTLEWLAAHVEEGADSPPALTKVQMVMGCRL